MSGQMPVLMDLWEIAVAAGEAGTPLVVSEVASELVQRHPDSGMEFAEICHLVERAAAKRGVAVVSERRHRLVA